MLGEKKVAVENPLVCQNSSTVRVIRRPDISQSAKPKLGQEQDKPIGRLPNRHG